MATSNTKIRKQQYVNDFVTRVRNPAIATVQWWDGNNPGPTRIQVAALGPEQVNAPTTANLPGTDVDASTITSMVKTFAKLTTVYRRARSGLITDTGTTDDVTNICRLIDSYQLTYTYGEGNILTDEEIEAAEVNSYMDSVRAIAAQAQTSAAVVDLRVCHSSCHSNCHGSRGRR